MRRKINKSLETTILLKSRRRCCICFGLNRDKSLKSGQIAHLDKNPSNNKEENLAFLCFEHHDEYDSITRQKKGLSQQEVKYYRSELYESLGGFLKSEVHFGEIQLPSEDPYAGLWTRVGSENESAEIFLTPVSDGLRNTPRYAITGLAFWGTKRGCGPNIGEIQFVEEISKNEINHYDPSHSIYYNSDTSLWEIKQERFMYSIKLSFLGKSLLVKEENWLGAHGMNVCFDGEYQRIA
jgi:hypothetical protein